MRPIREPFPWRHMYTGWEICFILSDISDWGRDPSRQPTGPLTHRQRPPLINSPPPRHPDPVTHLSTTSSPFQQVQNSSTISVSHSISGKVAKNVL